MHNSSNRKLSDATGKAVDVLEAERRGTYPGNLAAIEDIQP